jgi:hypothetical protein
LTINQTVRAVFTGISKTYSGTTTINSGATLQISSNQSLGAITLNAGGTLLVDAGCTLTITDTWTGGGTIVNNGTIVLAGPAFFPGSSTLITAMNNLQINSAGGVTIDKPIAVSGNLLLTNGIITTSSTNLLSITNTSALAVSGGSASSFINGPVLWSLPTDLATGSNYAFPLGKNGTYLPMTIVDPITGPANTTITAESFTGDAGGTAGNIPGVALGSLSNTEYWSLLSSGSLINHSLSLTRPGPVDPYNRIGRSTTSTGIYSSIGGTPSGNSITGSSITGAGASQFLTLAEAGPINITGSNTLSNGDYMTLETAFDAINARIQTGYDIKVSIYGNTSESFTATLNQGTWLSLTIQPEGAGTRTITGALPGASLIDLNGADLVTIDGRTGGTGVDKNLLLINTSSSDDAGTSTIRFIESAMNNTIQYCQIQGSESTGSSGIIFFSTGSLGTGNNNNTIAYNDLSSSGTYAANAIYSLGSTGIENQLNTITNNSIHDIFVPDVSSNAIFISSNNSAWDISSNNFYQTATFVSASDKSYTAIKVDATGSSFNISQNTIGGSSSASSGSWIKTGDKGSFTGISFSTSGTGINIIDHNTIKNFNWSNNDFADWTGISVNQGNTNIDENIIGSVTTTGSVSLTNGKENGFLRGIAVSGQGSVNIMNNSIGGLVTDNTVPSLGTGITGIYITGVSGTKSITNNIIGSTTVSGSISANAYSGIPAFPQDVYGILNSGGGTITITGNSIANMVNGITLANPTNGQICGISSSNGTSVISGNTIRNLNCIGKNTGLTGSTIACAGISVDNSAACAHQISGNLIYSIGNLNNLNTAVLTTGIFYNGGSAPAEISKN